MRVCCVVATDGGFFDQAVEAVASIRRHAGAVRDAEIAIGVVAIDLDADQRARLVGEGVLLFDDLDRLPRYDGQPRHGYAATCRPYLTDLFPGFDAILHVDADVRFLRPEGLAFWIGALAEADGRPVAAQECEPAYSVIAQPRKARFWAEARTARMERVWSGETLALARHFAPFNGGIYGARTGSDFWPLFRRHFEAAIARGYDHWADQDAMNVAFLDLGRWTRAPGTMNWIVSLAQPLAAADGSFRDPAAPERVIAVLHLTESQRVVDVGDGRRMKRIEAYRVLGYTR